MNRIGLRLPFALLLIFAIAFHPSMKIHLMEFTNPWLYMLFSPQMFFLLSFFLVISLLRISPKQIGVTVEPLQKNLTLGFGLGIGCYVLLIVANLVVGMVRPDLQSEGIFEWTPWLVFSYFILAPIAEELFFRGVVYHALRESYSPRISMIGSAILFAACHSSAMIGPFVLGLIAAKMTEKTKSIFPGMVFHAISNGLPWFFATKCRYLQFLDNYFFYRF